MQKFWVIWTFSANYSKLVEVEAKDAEEAACNATFLYGNRFQSEANIYVFDKAPAFQKLNKSECGASDGLGQLVFALRKSRKLS